MKDDIPRLFPVWLFPLVLFVLICSTQCGCKTGGVKLNPNSAGKIIKPKSPEQINKEAKAKREESQKFEQAKSPELKPVKIESVKTQPIAPKGEPIEIKTDNKSPLPKAAGAKTKLSPTITDTGSLPVKIDTKSTDALIPILPKSKGIDLTGDIVVTYEAAPTKTNWIHLFSLFMMLFTGALILWVVYDIVKDIFDMRKQGTPMKDHLDNLKKPARGTKASRKRAVKTAKKKTPKKKD